MARHPSTPSVPRAAIISGAFTFFDEPTSSHEPLPVRFSVVDPLRQQKLQRVVKMAVGLALAICAVALVRIAVDSAQGESAQDAPSQTKHTQ